MEFSVTQSLFFPSSMPVDRGFTYPSAPPSHYTNPYIIPNFQISTSSSNSLTKWHLLKARLNFIEFNGTNPRGWLRKYENFCHIYSILESEKLDYVTILSSSFSFNLLKVIHPCYTDPRQWGIWKEGKKRMFGLIAILLVGGVKFRGPYFVLRFVEGLGKWDPEHCIWV